MNNLNKNASKSYDIYSEINPQTNWLTNDEFAAAQTEINNAAQYTNDLYNSKRGQKAFNRLNRFAERKNKLSRSFLRDKRQYEMDEAIGMGYSKRDARRNVNNYMKSYDKRINPYATSMGTSDVRVSFADITTSNNDPIKGTVYVGPNTRIVNEVEGRSDLYTPGGVTSHELAHNRNLFTNPNLLKKKHINWLSPEKPLNDHDNSIAESYADLMDLKTSMYNAGIVDGTKERYRNKHIREYQNYLNSTYGDGVSHRYLNLHSNIRNVRKALNRIYRIGGKLDE